MGTTAVLRVLYFFLPAYVANLTPVLVQGRLRWLDHPLDFGRSWRGIRVFGAHKTWRGLLAGTVAGTATFVLQQRAWEAGWVRELAPIDYGATPLLLGVLLGVGTGVGDAVKSFFKRRVGIGPGEPWFGFDQVDFLLGAYVFAAPYYLPPLVPYLVCLPIVGLGSAVSTIIGYGLGLKASWI